MKLNETYITKDNTNYKWEISDPAIVNAEVKILKFSINDINVDISINQSGGIFTYTFFNECDNLNFRDYFFKKALIIIKAFCM